MKPTLIILAVLACIVGLVLFIRSRVAATYQISSADIGKVITQLRKSKEPIAWAQMNFLCNPNDSESDVAIDYSVKNGVLEFNWTLLSPRNIADKQKVIDLLRANGHTPIELVAENGTPYIKVTDGNLENIGNLILEQIYHQAPTLELIGDGFDWPQDGLRKW
jgi:hypothetical protein